MVSFFPLPTRSWKVGEEALKVFQAQVCSMARTEGVHWTINNDINVWQIKWLVNNLLTALTSELLSGIDQPAVPGFVWQDGSLWFPPATTTTTTTPHGMNGESCQKNFSFAFQVACVCNENQNQRWWIITTLSQNLYLSHSHKIIRCSVVRICRLFKSFNLKLLVSFNNSGRWLLCSQLPCCWFTWKPCKW